MIFNVTDNIISLMGMTTAEAEDGFVVRVVCNPQHPIYQTHFPEHPITPGVCLLQTAGILLQQKLGRPVQLTAARSIKFLNVLIPEEDKQVEFRFTHLAVGETECKVQVEIADDGTTYSKMSLTFGYEPYRRNSLPSAASRHARLEGDEDNRRCATMTM